MNRFEPEAFGKYFLVDKIATGGMAEIFKAKSFGHGGFENLVVIKRILGHLGENEDFVEMFIDEAKVSVALQHQNIVRVYDFGKVFENYFIAMECVDGKDVRAILRKLARERRYLPLEFAIYIAHEVCRGLSYAHQKTDLRGHPFGLVHRDMSPSNVLVSYEGDVKIADFGIAKAEMNSYNTADGVLKGKFEYMSPEQARGEEVDPRSDLFSIGIILYEMLTGRRLFKGESDVATLEAIKKADVPAPSSVTPRVPPELDAIVLKALNGDREHRYQNAGELQVALRALLNKPLDTLHDQLADFLADLFNTEITQEVTRLEEGSAVAAAWKETADESLWDGHSTATATILRQGEPPSRKRGMAMVVVALLAFLIVGAAGAVGAAWVLSGRKPAPVATTELIPPVQASGRLNVTVLPSARIFVDDQLRSEGTNLLLENLEDGEYVVRLEVEGAQPYEQLVRVTNDSVANVSHTFTGLSAPPEEPTGEEVEQPRDNAGPSSVIARTGTVEFTSTPSGATVYVDGDSVGTTPTTWTGRRGRTYDVQMKLGGYRQFTGEVKVSGSNVSFSRELKRATSSPGTVAIGIIGGGWGNVYIDGKAQDQTAPAKYTLSAGSHEVRVVNESLGLDFSQKVTVTAGETIRLNARP